jgi:uncharacterized membrane protein YkoI
MQLGETEYCHNLGDTTVPTDEYRDDTVDRGELTMKSHLLSALGVAIILLACNSSGPTTRFDPPSTEFAGELGITTPPPVTQEQAMAIGAAAAGGTAISVGQETEGGQLFFEVQVQTASGNKEVEVRAADGAVVEIEAGDND